MSDVVSSDQSFWLEKPEKHDYPAADSFLRLIFSPTKTEKLVKKLKKEKMTHFQAKDIFRASGLPLLGVGNSHVNNNVLKIKAGEKMSPILLVRDTNNGKVIIADGYHRLCAVYLVSEDLTVPCKIV